jgi:hypothetical protein
MKLIHCKKCHDVVRLIHSRWRMCECKQAGGQYNDDLLSATIGGDCDIIGIPNPFFDEINKYLIEENGGKQFYRDQHGWGTQDIWYGGGPGDIQVCRVKTPKGPKLQMTVEVLDENHTMSVITDKREYTIDGKKLPYIILQNRMHPSFKQPEPETKENPTTKVVRAAMKEVSKDVRAPKVVRNGTVKKSKGKKNE